MGGFRRLIGVAGVGLVFSAAIVAPGCGDDAKHEQRVRERHLKPRNLKAERAQRRVRTRVATPDGKLLPSDKRVAGVLLPRGLSQVHTRDHAWYFESRAPLSALQAYFGPRLLTGQVELGGRGRVTYVNAQPKDSETPRAVSVRIGPAPRDPRKNEVYISEASFDVAVPPTHAEARAKLEARRRYAD